MSDVTVKQLAETVGASVDRLLKQMQEAGLPHSKDEEAVSEEQKQTLLTYLKRSHGSADATPRKITLKRTSVGTLKTGQGRTGRNVKVEVRRKRTYIKRGEPETEAGDGGAVPATAIVSQSELERARIHEEEQARQAGEEQNRAELAQRKADEEQRREDARLKEEQEQAEAARVSLEEAKAQEAAIAPVKAEDEDPAAKVLEAAVDAQAKELAGERGGKRAKGKTHEKARGDEPHRDGKGGGRRNELSLKSDRRGRRKALPRVRVEQLGGEFAPTDFIAREVEIGDFISVGDMAQQMALKAGEVIKQLMGLGVMATINQVVDQDTAILLINEMGHKVKIVHADAIEQALVKSLQVKGEGETRAPVVTVMGHVDHGKTSLLDYIRKSKVTSGEAGGITQHIGAYSVDMPSGRICFIDTPGHAAFTAMRARGARVTDIVILVVAADDGVMPQTVEAIAHAKAAGVPIIVAINKCDLEGADPEKVTNELVAKDVIPEKFGGETQFIRVSAHTGQGIDELLEAILLQSEILELKAVKDAPGRGVVIESRLDRGRGPVTTVLIQNGTLKQGDMVIAGENHGRVRAMLNDRGEPVMSAGPSEPVEILGINGTPAAGDDLSTITNERAARDLADFRREKSQEARHELQQAAKLENMFANMGEGEKRVMKMVLKTDVRGSLEAISQSLIAMGNSEVSVNILGQGVGGITETDANLALTYGATVFGFNVRADNRAKAILEREGVGLRYYSIIYELLDDVKAVLTGMLAPEIREEIIGIAEVRDVFRSPRFGQVAGCMVLEGMVLRNKPIRVLRNNVVIFQGELESLRRFKEDVSEVRNATECGIGVRNYNDVRAGDLIEVFDTREVARELA